MRPLIMSSLHQLEKDKHFVQLLVKEFGLDFYVDVSDREKSPETDLETAILYPRRALFFGDFSSVNWDMIRPLDARILKMMAKHEYIALKMSGRMTISKDSFEEQRQYYFKHVRLWHHVLLENNIDFFIHLYTPHSGCDYIAYALCRVLEIPTLLHGDVPAFGRNNPQYYPITSLESHFCERYELYAKMCESGRVISDDELLPSVSQYISAYLGSISKTPAPSEIEKSFKQRSELAFDYIQKSDYKGLMLRFFKSMEYQISRRLNKFSRNGRILSKGKRFYNKHSIYPDFTNSQKYIYLALHYQPECTTLPMGGLYVEQELIAQMLSYYLPKDVLMYVKEHPMPGYSRYESYYKELLDLPNVRLIKRDVNTLELTRNSVCVVTVTGTVGFEAIFNQTPVLMFGHDYYQNAPGVFNIETNEDCSRALNKIFNGEFSLSIEDVKRFLYSIQDYLMVDFVVSVDGEYKIHPVLVNRIKAMLVNKGDE